MENLKLSSMLGTTGRIKRTEFVRIIIQCLYSLGFERAASSLESESGILYKTKEISSLETQVLEARWDDCIETLQKIDGLMEETRATACYLILKQKIREFLNVEQKLLALNVLRESVNEFNFDKEKIHTLVCALILGKKENLISETRNKLLMDLEDLFIPYIVLPEGRLVHLVESAVIVQRDSCIYHNNSDETISLYEDHCCGRDQIPTETVKILNDHQNEVWHVQFSNNGRYLASCSRDTTAIIWTVSEEDIVLKHTLLGHSSAVSFVTWSPDDTMLATCGQCGVVKLWGIETGNCLHNYAYQNMIIKSCSWFPDSFRLACSGSSPDPFICTWDIEGNEIDVWKGERMHPVSELSITPDGENLICIWEENNIKVYNLKTKKDRIIPEVSKISSLSLSRDGQFLIVNMNSQEIHLWDVEGKMKEPITYIGHKQGEYVIRSCFGGSNCSFVASGSEDSQVYIWHRKSGKLLENLPGHGKIVNSVSWNPTNPQMLASASDDQTIRIWGPKKMGATDDLILYSAGSL